MGSRRRDRGLAGAALLLGLVAAWSGAADVAAAGQGRGWLTAAGGAESDLTLDPGPTPAVVPGGPFLSVIGGLGGRWGRPRHLQFDLAGQGWYERFTGTDDRAVTALTAVADLTVPWRRSWSARLGAGAHHYDDAARPTARRGAAWGEAGLVWSPGPWRLEAQAGAEGRRYPDLVLPDDAGTPGTYTEQLATAGVHAQVVAGGRLLLRAAGHARWTDARDPVYDAEGPAYEAGADLRLGAGLLLLLDGFYQERLFTGRPGGGQRDRYRQAGAGLELSLGRAWLARATFAVSRYTWPDGQDVDTHRWQAGLTYRFGAAAGHAGLPPPEDLHRTVRDADTGPRAGRPLEFRVHAPDAASVALVGDFNGWGADALPMHRAGGGWWRTSCRLAAGTHAYAYVVDGVWLTPPEAAATEPDGFGGRNGLLVVLP